MNTNSITAVINLYRRDAGDSSSLLGIADRAEAQLHNLEKQLESLLWNDELGCYTRQAFENVIWPEICGRAEWAIFFDVDGMHDMNTLHGWDKTSAIIKQALVMRSSDHVAGQVMSGDEFFVVVSGNAGREDESDPARLCARILENLRKSGASATFAYMKVQPGSYQENLQPIKDLVEHKKRTGERSTISFIDFPNGLPAEEDGGS